MFIFVLTDMELYLSRVSPVQINSLSLVHDKRNNMSRIFVRRLVIDFNMLSSTNEPGLSDICIQLHARGLIELS